MSARTTVVVVSRKRRPHHGNQQYKIKYIFLFYFIFLQRLYTLAALNPQFDAIPQPTYFKHAAPLSASCGDPKYLLCDMSQNNSDQKELVPFPLSAQLSVTLPVGCQLRGRAPRLGEREGEIWRAHYIHAVNQNASAQPQHRVSRE